MIYLCNVANTLVKHTLLALTKINHLQTTRNCDYNLVSEDGYLISTAAIGWCLRTGDQPDSEYPLPQVDVLSSFLFSAYLSRTIKLSMLPARSNDASRSFCTINHTKLPSRRGMCAGCTYCPWIAWPSENNYNVASKMHGLKPFEGCRQGLQQIGQKQLLKSVFL